MPETQKSNAQQARPAAPRRNRPGGGYLTGSVLVIGFTALCILVFLGLVLRPKTDNGVRLWILNHTPDQVVIINPFSCQIEKRFLVADGLKGLTFSRDNSKAYIYNVVDVANHLTVIDTKTYLEEEVIEVDGVPQGIGVFPEMDKLAVILGSKTDFMAGGFDVLDLKNRSEADPNKQKRFYRERDMQLTHQIAVGDDGDRIYCIDAKSSNLSIFSLLEKRLLRELDLQGAAEYLLYPRTGNYYYISVLQHNAIYQFNKQTDAIEAAYTNMLYNPANEANFGKLRNMAIDSDGRYLFAAISRQTGTKYIAIWDLKDRTRNCTPFNQVFPYPQGVVVKDINYYTPAKGFQLKGGYNDEYGFVPTGDQVAVDPFDQYLFVVDDYGALYIYNMEDVLATNYEPIEGLIGHTPDSAQDAAEARGLLRTQVGQVVEGQLRKLEILEPHGIVTELENRTTEIRDIKVAQPAVGKRVSDSNDVSGG